jgi:GT2 family glycosyltransferase
LEENRTALLNRARGGWLLMLDDDMTFPHDLAEKLDGHIEDGKDIVTGLYFLGYKQKPAPAIYTTDTTMGNPAAFYYNYPEDQLVEVGGCGMGVCMISRRVLNAFLGKEAFNRVYKMGTRVGEDLAFCYKARERGFRIWCDTSVKAGHIRPYTLTDNQPFVTMETYGKSFNG